MQIIQGKIQEISKEDPNNKGFKKKIITIHSSDNQSAFVEFRGAILKFVDDIEEGDEVIVAIQMKGSTSKKSGIKFNNLIAKSIRKVA